MTETLEDYLAGEYHTDMEDIRELEEKLRQVANVFIYSCIDGRWPYEVRRPNGVAPKKDDKPSQGTQAMIAAALAKMTGSAPLASGKRAGLDLESKDDLKVVLAAGIDCLLKNIEPDKGLRSGTFGQNDPVTLSHATDLLRGMRATGQEDKAKSLEAALKMATDKVAILGSGPVDGKELFKTLPSFHAIQEGEVFEAGKEPKFDEGRVPTYLENAFVPLRVVRAVKDLELSDVDLRNYRVFFEATLHQQLSFSSIPDSRFDPAELIFCLEGLMLSGRHVVDEKLFDRVLDVLRDKQTSSAHWHPTKPIYATPQGLTMLPVSVEGGISLMRSITIMDERSDFQRVSTGARLMLRRFWQWLRARIAKFDGPEDPQPLPDIKNKDRYKDLLGWHSEHVNDPGLIHLWDTSQVVEFMLGYRELLQRSVAGKTLQLSRLQINVHSAEPKKNWPEYVARSEPRLGAVPGRKVYVEIGRDFIDPWVVGAPRNYSMLVYGPPGTGKSSLAENIAKTLGMRMVTVTVSDFLGRGSANMEARAKAIFQTLEAQSDTVILFDEIDSFLLDRDSKFYTDQETVFQFLTPGMLTKINDLRKKERSIFIIATNYANRIDPAIKRKGRIDKQYLLQLPNVNRRLKILTKLGDFELLDGATKDKIAYRTLFFGFSDLKGTIKDASLDPRGEKKDDELIQRNKNSAMKIYETLKDPDRNASTSISSHLVHRDKENYPVEELAELIMLKREVCPGYDVDAMTKEFPDLSLKTEIEAELKKELESKIRG